MESKSWIICGIKTAKILREQQFQLDRLLHYLNKTKGFKYGKLCKWIDYKYIDYDD